MAQLCHLKNEHPTLRGCWIQGSWHVTGMEKWKLWTRLLSTIKRICGWCQARDGFQARMGFQVEAEKELAGPGRPLLVDPRGFQPRAARARCDLVILGALRKSGSSPSYHMTYQFYKIIGRNCPQGGIPPSARPRHPCFPSGRASPLEQLVFLLPFGRRGWRGSRRHPWPGAYILVSSTPLLG